MDRELNDADPDVDRAIAVALDAVTGVLRSGGTLRAALDAVTTDRVLGTSVRALLLAADSGLGLRDALARAARRHASPDWRFVMAAMVLAIDTGAAQAPTLDVVAQRVRDRIALRREIRAAAASARASALVVAAAPLAFAAVVAALDRSVLAGALDTSVGRACMGGGLVLEALGVWWMHRLTLRPLARGDAARDDLPELVDLLGLAVRAGLGVPGALAAASALAPGLPGRAARVAAGRLAAGATPAGALEPWPDQLGDEARPLVAVLLAAHRDGAPLAEALDHLGADLRHARRMRATERARRLPVLLLFPLAGCVLPAFVLLTVVPIAIGSLGALHG